MGAKFSFVLNCQEGVCMDRMIKDISDFIFVYDRPEKADVIFIPGGSYPELPEYAATLFKQGYANRILPSGGVSVKTGRFPGVKSKGDIYCGDYKTECGFYTDVLIKNGADCAAIYKEDRSGSTQENAFFSRAAAAQYGLTIKTAILVCKSFHARRCLMLYQLAFPETQLCVCPVDCSGITKHNWHTFEDGIDRVLGELARCGNQFMDEIKEYLCQRRI